MCAALPGWCTTQSSAVQVEEAQQFPTSAAYGADIVNQERHVGADPGISV